MCYNKTYISNLIENSRKQASLFYTASTLLTIGFLINVFVGKLSVYSIVNSLSLSTTLVLSLTMMFRYRLQIGFFLKKVICLAMLTCFSISIILIVPSQLHSPNANIFSDIVLYFGWNCYAMLMVIMLHKRYSSLQKEWLRDKQNN